MDYSRKDAQARIAAAVPLRAGVEAHAAAARAKGCGSVRRLRRTVRRPRRSRIIAPPPTESAQATAGARAKALATAGKVTRYPAGRATRAVRETGVRALQAARAIQTSAETATVALPTANLLAAPTATQKVIAARAAPTTTAAAKRVWPRPLPWRELLLGQRKGGRMHWLRQ